MALPAWLANLGNLVLLRDRVREARTQVNDIGGARARATDQARLLMEIARRVAEPVEALPAGATASVQLGLYADAAYWALTALLPPPPPASPPASTAAGTTIEPSEATSGLASPGAEPERASTVEPPANLMHLFELAPADVVGRAAGDPETLARVKSVLGQRRLGGDLHADDKDAAAARQFVEAVVWELDAPERRIEHLLVQRWLRIGAAVVVLLAVGFGIRAAAVGPNLVADRPFRTSSSYEPCGHKGMCADLMFHTQPEDNPWVEFDLGGVKPIHRVEVTNRSDCCAERIAGLILEVSNDQKHWTELARNNSVFAKWSPSFPKRSTRYVRLRIPHNTALHLDDVQVF